MPNLARLKQAGVWCANGHSVFPTVTRVNSASIGSGTVPSVHGIVSNTMWVDAVSPKPFDPFTQGYYVNTEPSEDEKRLRGTYGENYPRLVQLKNKYDPTNLFHLNANIKPTVKA